MSAEEERVVSLLNELEAKRPKKFYYTADGFANSDSDNDLLWGENE